jgi:hypothetical protein
VSKTSPQLATLLARQRSYTCSAEIISVHTNASSPQLATLLARQPSYTRSAEIISIPTDALSPQLAILLARQHSYTRCAEIIFVPTDALNILTDASGTTPLSDTLRGLASSTHTFAPTLATRSGAMLCIGVYLPGIGNTLGGCASY